VGAAALKHTRGWRLASIFRFADHPEGWKILIVSLLCTSLAGVFDIEEVRPLLLT
jgi:hypothetical protein